MPETSHEKRIKLIDLPGLTHMYKNLKKIFIRIRDIDTSLDTNSSNPIANNVVTQKFNTIQSQLSNTVDQLSGAVIASGGTISKSGELATPAQIAAGIHTVQENAIDGAMVGDAVAANVLQGKTFTNAEESGLSGEMINLNAHATITHTSSNATKVILGDACSLSTNSDNNVRLQIRYNNTAGYLPTNTLIGIPQATAASAIGLTAAKIYKGNTVLGIAGTATTPESGKTGAAAAQILTGYQAFVNGNTINGSMSNQGAKTASLNCGESYPIPAGYHNGSGKVTANSLASQTGVDSGKTAAGDGQILTGYQAWVNGVKRTGSMKNNGTWISINGSVDSEITIPEGYHSGLGYVKVGYSGSGLLTTDTWGFLKGNGVTSKYYWVTDIQSELYQNSTHYFTGIYYDETMNNYYGCVMKKVNNTSTEVSTQGYGGTDGVYLFKINNTFYCGLFRDGNNNSWYAEIPDINSITPTVLNTHTVEAVSYLISLAVLNNKAYSYVVYTGNSSVPSGIYSFNGSASTKVTNLPGTIFDESDRGRITKCLCTCNNLIYATGITRTGFWSFNGTTFTALTNLPFTIGDGESGGNSGSGICLTNHNNTLLLKNGTTLWKWTGSAWTQIKSITNEYNSGGLLYTDYKTLHLISYNADLILNDLYVKNLI